jgi:hypothetical protein
MSPTIVSAPTEQGFCVLLAHHQPGGQDVLLKTHHHHNRARPGMIDGNKSQTKNTQVNTEHPHMHIYKRATYHRNVEGSLYMPGGQGVTMMLENVYDGLFAPAPEATAKKEMVL